MNKEEADFLAAFRTAADSPTAKWVEWEHRSMGISHCETCLKLDKCWFQDDKKPNLPQHYYCHCTANPISYSRVVNEAKADSDIRKFNPYLFYPTRPHGKDVLFMGWGYSVEDSEWLREEFIKQGREKYIAGEYELGVLDKYGQRISIRIEIPNRKTGKMVSFTAGWMVYSNGKIQLATPYGGE